MLSPSSLPERVGGRFCLDFVNTVDPRRPGEEQDYLTGYEEILDWFVAVDAPLPRSVSWLRKRAKAAPSEASAAFRQAVAMRESVFTVVDSARLGAAVRPTDLVRLNQALGESIGHRVLAAAERGGVREEWRTSDSLSQVLWPVAIDAWDLLTEPELDARPAVSVGLRWVRLALPRQEPGRQQALVRHAHLWEPRQGSGPLLTHRSQVSAYARTGCRATPRRGRS